jgi:hypothetical protein
MDFAVWNMHMCVRIPELLQKAKIDEIYHTGVFSDTHGYVVGFEVTMNEVARVYILEVMKLHIGDIRCITM